MGIYPMIAFVKAGRPSASISVAMNTTAFGLMVAIPLLLFHAKLTSTTGQIVDSLEMAAVKARNSISDFNKRYFETPSEFADKMQQVSKPESRVGTAR
jgi:biopolymer transport protein ExbB/TolQ